MDYSDTLKKALLGVLMGSGAYGGLRLLKNIPQQYAPVQEDGHDQIYVNLPKERFKTAAAPELYNASDIVMPVLSLLGGTAGGYAAAAGTYQKYQDKQINARLQKAEKEYLDTLEKIRQKQASTTKTPEVDNIIKGVVDTLKTDLTKTAFFTGVDIPSTSPVDAVADTFNNVTRGSRTGSALKALWTLMALGGAGATYGISRRIDSANKRKQERQELPYEVIFNNAAHRN